MRGGTGRAARLAAMAMCLAWSAGVSAAPGSPVDRTKLDTLVARIEVAEPEADQAAYRALADATLAEARGLYPAGHPEIAARELYGAISRASAGEMDQALAIIDRIAPQLKQAPGYRKSWRDTLSLRAYIASFKGDHAASLALNEQLVADYATDAPGSDHAVALSNLAAAYLEQGRLDEALERNARAIEMGLAIDPVPPAVAVWSANRIVYLYSAGRTEEAIAAAQNAIGRTGGALGGDHPMMANLYANFGAVLFRINRPHDAMPMIRRAFELTEKASGGPNQNSAAMRVQFAQALTRAGRYDDAIAFLDVATPIIDKQLGAQSDRALVARDTRLIALIGTGRGAEAQPLARELLAIRDERLPEGHRDRANARDNLAKAAFANADWVGAGDAAADAVAVRTKILPADHPDLLLSRAMLLRAQDRRGNRPAADLVAEARDLFAALTLGANLARGSAQAERQRPAYGWLAELFARRGAADDAFAAQQWAARSSIDDALAIAKSERAAAADTAFAARIAKRRQLLAARQGLNARIEANLARPDPAFDLVAVTGELAANRQAILALDAAFAPAELARLVFTPSTLAEMKAASSGSSATAMLTDLGGPWLVTLARGGKPLQYLIAADAPVGTLVARLRASLDAGEQNAFDRAAAGELYALLFPGEAAAMLRPARQLAVIANGSLGALPFGLLVPDARRGDYLIDRIALARRVRAPRSGDPHAGTAPADGMLIALGGVEGRKAGSLMAMRSAGTARAIDALPALPDAARELSALAAAIGGDSARLLIGERATEAELRATTVPRGAVLAFATHGLISGELDGLDEPALLLTPAGGDDGLLKPSEIGGLSLPARLVILSACNTAGAAGADRPQLSGLVQGFFLAGADEVMASHWPVRDDVARRLSVGTVRGLRAGSDPASALRDAIRDIRKGSDGEARVTHPTHWAPFELFSR